MADWIHTFNGVILIPTGSVTGSNPGRAMLFAKSDGKVYMKSSAGVEVEAGAAAGGGALNKKITYFTSSGTWTPQSGLQFAEIVLVPGGTGGGGGANGSDPSVIITGGGAGAGGVCRYYTISGSNLSGNYTVTVGAGGNGGAGSPWLGYPNYGTNGSIGGRTSMVGTNLTIKTPSISSINNGGYVYSFSVGVYPNFQGDGIHTYGTEYGKMYIPNSSYYAVGPSLYPYALGSYPNGWLPSGITLGLGSAGGGAGFTGSYGGTPVNGHSSDVRGIAYSYNSSIGDYLYTGSLVSSSLNTSGQTGGSNIMTNFSPIFGTHTILTSSLYGLGGGGSGPGAPTLGIGPKSAGNGGNYGAGGGGGSLAYNEAAGNGGNGGGGLVIIAEYYV